MAEDLDANIRARRRKNIFSSPALSNRADYSVHGYISDQTFAHSGALVLLIFV